MTKQLVFIDESGDPGFKEKSSVSFSFALVVFENAEQAEEVEKAINHAAVLSRHLSEFKYSKTCNRVKDIFFHEISSPYCVFSATKVCGVMLAAESVTPYPLAFATA